MNSTTLFIKIGYSRPHIGMMKNNEMRKTPQFKQAGYKKSATAYPKSNATEETFTCIWCTLFHFQNSLAFQSWFFSSEMRLIFSRLILMNPQHFPKLLKKGEIAIFSTLYQTTFIQCRFMTKSCTLGTISLNRERRQISLPLLSGILFCLQSSFDKTEYIFLAVLWSQLSLCGKYNDKPYNFECTWQLLLLEKSHHRWCSTRLLKPRPTRFELKWTGNVPAYCACHLCTHVKWKREV